MTPEMETAEDRALVYAREIARLRMAISQALNEVDPLTYPHAVKVLNDALVYDGKEVGDG